MQIIQIQQQPAASAPLQLGDEFGFRHVIVGKAQIGGGVFQKNAAPKRGLHRIDIAAQHRQALLAIRQRQQVMVKNTARAAPGDVFGDLRGAIAGN